MSKAARRSSRTKNGALSIVECRPVYVQAWSHSCARGGDTLLDEISDERRKILRDIVENTNLTMNSQKAYASIRRIGADNVSLPWSLMSVLTKSLTNYFRMEEGWNTEGHPMSAIKQSLQVTTSHQLSLLSRSAWTKSHWPQPVKTRESCWFG